MLHTFSSMPFIAKKRHLFPFMKIIERNCQNNISSQHFSELVLLIKTEYKIIKLKNRPLENQNQKK